eukprot:359731_1
MGPYNGPDISIILLINSFLLLTSSLVYYGPVTNEYFRSEFNPKIANSTKLSCNESSNAYVGRTTIDNPVQYFRLNITTEMKQKYLTSLAVTTCCDFDLCQENPVCNKR